MDIQMKRGLLEVCVLAAIKMRILTDIRLSET